MGGPCYERTCFALGHYSVAKGSLNDNRHAPWLRKCHRRCAIRHSDKLVRKSRHGPRQRISRHHINRRIDAFPAIRMRNQLEGVDAVAAVLGGGGYLLAGHAGWC